MMSTKRSTDSILLHNLMILGLVHLTRVTELCMLAAITRQSPAYEKLDATHFTTKQYLRYADDLVYAVPLKYAETGA